jgi:predicted dehydrogenase
MKKNKPVVLGLIGCGNISDSYFNGAAKSKLVTIKACADIRPEASQSKASQHKVLAMSIAELLADKDISIVINLTIPQAHAAVAKQILNAGKHVYLEKPLAATFKEAKALLAHAAKKSQQLKAAGKIKHDLRVGCAPDTFFGAGHQATRRMIDEGKIGTPVGGSVAVLSHGMEAWHPNPEFFFKAGGGPILDMGPYYVTQLVNLLGPVDRVAAVATIGNAQRTIGSQPLKGQKIDVEVATTVNGVLHFKNGANVTMSASWDVWQHKRSFIEIYGTKGSLLGLNPNFFGGEPMLAVVSKDVVQDWKSVSSSSHPFGKNNRELRSGTQVADYRIVGLVDMAMAIMQKRPHRASGELALHVLEVLEAFELSSKTGKHIQIKTACERPAAVPRGKDESVFI